MQAFDSEHPSSPVLALPPANNTWPAPLSLPTKSSDISDESLITLITTGSPSDSKNALATLYKRYYKDVWRFVRSKVSAATDADEVSAAVWLVVLEKIANFIWTGVPVKSWLLSIAHRKVMEHINTPHTLSLEKLREDHDSALHFIASQLDLFEQHEPVPPVPTTVKKEADELLHTMIRRLSKIERRIIMLIYFESVENATEVAQRLDMNSNTVRVYHKRARDKLRSFPELKILFERPPDYG
ncbi:MAG: sigma-70 family RNA polymerase sigma factor [Anaerolineae bacterium]|nr:sigma-70 family RNA polymerase sigma factor [Anaerolineae bacterium]